MLHRPLLARADLPAIIVSLVLSVAGVVAHMQAFPQFSPFDEATHLDYTLSIAKLELPSLGTPYDERVLSEWSCRGGWSDVTTLPPCGTESPDHTVYPARGIQRNPTGPLYYAVVAALSQPAASVTGTSPMGAARLTGALLLFLTSIVTSVAAQRLGASRSFAWGIASLVPLGMPLVLHATSTVNSDAGVLLVGAVTMLFAIDPRPADRRWVLAAIALAVAAALTKQTALFPIGTLAVAVSCHALLAADPLRRKVHSLLVAGALCLAAAVTLALWTAVVNSRTLENYENPIGMGNTVAVTGSGVDEAFSGWFYNLPPTNVGFVPVSLETPFQPSTAALLTLAIVAGIGSAIASTDVLRRSLGWGIIAGCVGSVFLVQFVFALFDARYFPTPIARYGIGLVPGSLVLMTLFFDSRRDLRFIGWVVVALAAAASLASLHP